MAVSIVSLNSGSNGNCYYVGNADEALLVDAGISCRETEKRMAQLGLPMQRVKAIFVSHEHTDHISGIPVLAKKYNLPVYLTAPLLQKGCIKIEPHQTAIFTAFETISIGSLRITGFPKYHDACDPHSFVITDGSVMVGVFTDIGFPCKELTRHFKMCHAAFLEANYDEDMLRNGRYPYHLKKRISNGHGHLSNRQALEVFKQFRPSFMSHLLPAHLSSENNCPKLVQALFSQHAGSTQITVASRHAASPLYFIKNEKPASIAAGPMAVPVFQQPQMQLSLF